MNKLILAITAGLAAYKQERVEAVIDTASQAIAAHMTASTPARIGLITEVASAIVTKTYEDSVPLLTFLQATQGLVDHYGPAVLPAFTKSMTEIISIGLAMESSPAFVEFNEAMSILLTDVNEQPAPARPFGVVAADGSITH